MSVIDRFFKAPEVEQLHRDIVDLGAISPDLLVPFEGQRLRDAHVAWLNRRWFLARGVDVTLPGERERVDAWLVAEFGYSVIEASLTSPATERKIFHADRYGSTEGTTPHGGSGRSGIAGRFSAKGIGITPLVGRGAAPGHAHGCATLEECLREAVYSEVIGAEAPHGAVPTIAVLDAGLDFADPDARTPSLRQARRGLLIRPCVLRPAHVERAPLFRRGDGMHERQHQTRDVERTRAVAYAWVQGALPEAAAVSPDTLISRLAQQIAFAQVHRLTSGGIFSSNVSLRGEWLDFGNAHALPDWSHAKLLDHAAGFGAEQVALRTMSQSLAFYLCKYGGRGERVDASEARLLLTATQAYQDAWQRECLDLFKLAGKASACLQLVAAIRARFEKQQRRRVRYQYGRAVDGPAGGASWLGDEVAALAARSSIHASVSEDTRKLDVALRAACAELDPGLDPQAAYQAGLRRLRQRPSLDRGELIDAIHRLIHECIQQNTVDSRTVEAALDDLIGRSRSLWRALPPSFVVHAQKALGSSSVLLCTDGHQGRPVIWMEGTAMNRRLRLFDAWLEPDGWDELHVARGTWSATVAVPSFEAWLKALSPAAQATCVAPAKFQWYS